MRSSMSAKMESRVLEWGPCLFETLAVKIAWAIDTADVCLLSASDELLEGELSKTEVLPPEI